MEHLIPSELLERRVVVHLIGAGGNGGQMAGCLARLDVAMRALGHPFGIHVTVLDDDRVTEANVGRQIFSMADVVKAVTVVHRLNMHYGLDWDAYPVRYEGFRDSHFKREPADFVISCVDSRLARRRIHDRLFESRSACYWLDLGNTENTAQVVLGEPVLRKNAVWLPCVTELFSDLLDETIPDENMPSCSVRMSLASQGLFINDVTVRFAAQLLYELFSSGRISQHGALINFSTRRCAPIEIEPRVWERFAA